tara:strand:- start:1023 stop:2426 length:1404 start_codon:yes stop_codon:yes gene_type:complete
MKLKSTDRVCVVGGGLAGLAAAALAQRQGVQSVTLVESAPKLGGLLRSRHIEGMGSFDFGTHVLEDTGIEVLDEALFQGMESSDGWNAYASCPSATFFGGNLSKSGFVDVRGLGDEVHNLGLKQMLGLPRFEGAENLDQYVRKTFGDVFAEKVFSPVLKKFFGTNLEELIPLAHHLVGMSRLVCGTPEEAKALKAANDWNDERFAFHDPRVGARPVRHLYPQSGGIGQWAEKVTTDLQAKGVAIKAGTAIDSCHIEGCSVTSLNLADKTTIAFDQLIWTAPPFALLKVVGAQMPAGMVRPRFCQTLLFDFIIDQPVKMCDVFYVSCYDPSMKTFRVTLYDVLEGRPGRTPSRLTVEVMLPPVNGAQDEKVSESNILAELVQMGVLPVESKILKSATQLVSPGFPVMTPQFIGSCAKLTKAAGALAENVTLLGRASGQSFFMRQVLQEVHDTIVVGQSGLEDSRGNVG